jgi:tRNA threonylcarbamoyl adenosine modification protein YeaZ
MTRVLAFDTATEVVAIGVGAWPDAEEDSPAEVLGTLDFVAPRAACERLLPAVKVLLRTLGLEPDDLDAVVVGRGPGSFTGVRIGVATAKGLARGLGRSLYGVSTLDAVAMRFAGHEGVIGIVGDAMRREVYPALFRCSGGDVTRMTTDEVGAPADVAARWAEEIEGGLLLAGNGLAKYADVFIDALGERVTLAPRELWTPGGAGLLAAAFASRDIGDGEPGAVLPVYTRLSDAEEAEIPRGGMLPASGVAGDAGSPAAGPAREAEDGR